MWRSTTLYMYRVILLVCTRECVYAFGHRHACICTCMYMYVYTEMARDTPGSPMSRSRDLVGGVGGAATTLTSAGYHTTSGDPAALHGHVLQQKILEVTWKRSPSSSWRIRTLPRRTRISSLESRVCACVSTKREISKFLGLVRLAKSRRVACVFFSYSSNINFNSKFCGNSTKPRSDSWPSYTSNRCIS